MATALVAASMLLASCSNGIADSGPSGTATVPTKAAITTTSGRAPSTSTTTPPPLLPRSGEGAFGFVTAGPTCPVERQGQPCPPRPVSAEIDAHNAGGATVGSTRTDSHGRYALDLSPGSYELVAVVMSSLPRCPNTPVDVQRGSATRLDISCDTGIR